MLEYMPDYYDGVQEMIALLKAEGVGFDKVAAETNRVLLNTFVDQADSDGLAIMENQLHIDTDLSLSLESRRYAIKMRMLPPHPITFKYLKDLIKSFNIPAEVQRDVQKQILTTISDYDELTREQLDRLKYLLNVYVPANMVLDIQTHAETSTAIKLTILTGMTTYVQTSIPAKTNWGGSSNINVVMAPVIAGTTVETTIQAKEGD
ncbi:putative phage tail protein [uncultured Secundilactobacillus sp.]|uniref:putative phage tail protein n=1 Tax=uncultured Secundilactobacillus sp. TaxID=2813935 RepID=UPI0025895A7A|nr:putative phage tail protein [uncultured Secundilactobacillus sp.]